ncbi:MAG: PhzF family phenazine biosynthesis protein [Pseudomonadota bacterium]
MSKRRFIQCDVFSTTPTKGNGLAVVLDADGLEDEQMQAFAAWTNLAETTFLLPPGNPAADYRVRIFTPKREMLFAGHPTLGSCASWLHAGGVPKDANIVRQECAIGLVEIDQRGPVPAFAAPPTQTNALPDENLAAICAALKIPRSDIIQTAWLDNGPVWQVLELKDAAAVLAVEGTGVRWPEFKPIGLIGAWPPGSDLDFEVRMLAPSSGMDEDPITGSLNSALACWLADQDRLTSDLRIAQGSKIGRMGRVHVRRDAEDSSRILIGGHTNILIDGTVDL